MHMFMHESLMCQSKICHLSVLRLSVPDLFTMIRMEKHQLSGLDGGC